MKKSLGLMVCLVALLGLGNAQSGYLPVVGTLTADASSAKASGTICVQAVTSAGVPATIKVGGAGGQIVYTPGCQPIAGGSFTINMPDTALTSPLNACLSVVVKDSLGRVILRKPCVQPTSAAGSAWCSQVGGVQTCNFDQLPNTDPAFPVEVGPQGPKGDPGCVIGSTCTSALLAAPTANQTATNAPGTFTSFNAPGVQNGFLTSDVGQTVRAWGNSQAQGYDPADGCSTLTCHPSFAWPAVFAAKMGWVLDNQAWGSSNCADLTYQGTSESLWDLIITAGSRNIYAHIRNDASQYGFLPINLEIVHGCLAAQVAWLAIQETRKLRASGTGCTKTGSWTNGSPNSASAYATTAGATATCQVLGKTVLLAANRIYGGTPASYTVSVDGSLVYDPITASTTFTQYLSPTANTTGSNGFPNETISSYLIRVPGLADVPHTVVYNCVNPGATGCLLSFTAGVGDDNATTNGPIVYAASTLLNAPAEATGNLAPLTTSLFHDEWKRMVAEMQADGLQVVGLDVTNPSVYNPADPTQVQADGQHPAIAGTSSIGLAMASKASLAASLGNKAEAHASNSINAYDCVGAGAAPSANGAGATVAAYYMPKGCLYSSTGPHTGVLFLGSDGTTHMLRLDGVYNTGSRTILFNDVTGVPVDLGVSGYVVSAFNAPGVGGTLRAYNGANYVGLFQVGGTSPVGSWPAYSSVLEASSQGPLVLDSYGSAASMLFQVNRVTVAKLSPSGLAIPSLAATSGTHAVCADTSGVLGPC